LFCSICNKFTQKFAIKLYRLVIC